MVCEHCKCSDSDKNFTTGSYWLTTTSKTEWCFVVDPAVQEARPMERMLVDRSLLNSGEAGIGSELLHASPNDGRARQVFNRVIGKAPAFWTGWVEAI